MLRLLIYSDFILILRCWENEVLQQISNLFLEKVYYFFRRLHQKTSIITHAEESTSKTSKHDEPINFFKELPSGHPPFIVEPDVKEAEDKIWKS